MKQNDIEDMENTEDTEIVLRIYDRIDFYPKMIESLYMFLLRNTKYR